MVKKLVELVWLAVGAGIALAFIFLLIYDPDSPFILVPIAGSVVYLFALTDSDESQPRALFGGHLGSAVIGILCFRIFGDAFWVYIVAVVAAMVFMMSTRTIHPPAGANPLVLIHDHAGFIAILNPITVGIIVLFIVTMIWSRLRPGKIYPKNGGEGSMQAIPDASPLRHQPPAPTMVRIAATISDGSIRTV